METSDLSSPGYWESEEVDLRLNPRRPVASAGLRTFLVEELGLRACVVLATSGSSGKAKFVVLPRRAILSSAQAVNAHCGLTNADVWLGGLSTFHVGGIGIFARAHCSGATVVPMAWDGWSRDGTAFLEAVRGHRATLTSLTPAHLWDLFRARRRSPETLRGVFLGGGAIDPFLVEEARALGWPIWPTYGMSEAASQIATSPDGDGRWLDLLPIWETTLEVASGRLAIRGPALFSGYVEGCGESWRFDPARDSEGWYVTGDRCELEKGRVRFVARGDDAVKVLGELVSLGSLHERLAEFGIQGGIVALPHPRRGHELVLVREPGAAALTTFQEGLAPVEQINREVVVPFLPRTDIGKVDRAALEALAIASSTDPSDDCATPR